MAHAGTDHAARTDDVARTDDAARADDPPRADDAARATTADLVGDEPRDDRPNWQGWDEAGFGESRSLFR